MNVPVVRPTGNDGIRAHIWAEVVSVDFPELQVAAWKDDFFRERLSTAVANQERYGGASCTLCAWRSRTNPSSSSQPVSETAQ